MVECNRAEFAAITGYSTRQVSKWIAAGMPAVTTGKKGAVMRIDTALAIPWLLKRASGGAVRQDATAHQRLLAARAQKTELEVAAIQRRTIPVEDHEADMQALAAFFVSGLSALPARLAAERRVVSPISLSLISRMGCPVAEAFLFQHCQRSRERFPLG